MGTSAVRRPTYPPHFEDRLVVQEDVAESWVLGLQPNPRALFAVALDRELTAEKRQNDRALDRRARPIDDCDIAWKEPDPCHALAGDAHGKGCCRIFDQKIVEIERTVQIVIGWRREAHSAEVAIKGIVVGCLTSISIKALISPARRSFAARRLANVATGSGRRTTLVGSLGGPSCAVRHSPPPDFLLQKIWRGIARCRRKRKLKRFRLGHDGHSRYAVR
jgi:hypothetical protein